MNFKEQLLQDFKESMKNKQTLRKNTIQAVRAAALQMEKDKKIVPTDEDFVQIIATEVKKRKNSLPDFERSGRQDLIDELKEEIRILMAYLPEQVSEADLQEIVQAKIKILAAESMKDMGKVMGALTSELAGKADMKQVSQIVKKLLNHKKTL